MGEKKRLTPMHVSRALRRAGFGAQDLNRGFGGYRCRTDKNEGAIWVTWYAPDSMHEIASKEEIDEQRQHMLSQYKNALSKLGYSVRAGSDYSLYVSDES